MDIKLYISPSCYFCKRVTSYLKDTNRQLEMVNIDEDSEALSFLVGLTGRSTVPCLVVDGQPMHESLDIIQWLKDNPEAG